MIEIIHGPDGSLCVSRTGNSMWSGVPSCYHAGVDWGRKPMPPRFPMPALSPTAEMPWSAIFSLWLRFTDDFDVSEYIQMLAEQGYFDEEVDDCCEAQHPHGWYCTCAVGHESPHIAEGCGGDIIAAWGKG